MLYGVGLIEFGAQKILDGAGAQTERGVAEEDHGEPRHRADAEEEDPRDAAEGDAERDRREIPHDDVDCKVAARREDEGDGDGRIG